MLPSRRVERALRDVITIEEPDVVLFMAPWPLPVLGPRLGIPWAACSHGAELVLPSRVPGLRSLLARSLRGAGCLFSVSCYTACHLRALVGAAGPPIRLLRTGVDLATFHPGVDGGAVRRRHGLGDDPVIVCVGRLVARKGQDVLIRAMPEVRRRIPDARLLLVGEGPMQRKLEKMAGEVASGAVTFTGRVPWGELPGHHAAGDVFSSPNRSRWRGLEQEGFGVIFLEAQACGRPVVAGRSGGAPEALVEGETGLLVDGASVRQVAAALVDLLREPSRARRMGEAGRRFVEDNFAWDGIIGRLVVDLEAVVAGKSPESDA